MRYKTKRCYFTFNLPTMALSTSGQRVTSGTTLVLSRNFMQHPRFRSYYITFCPRLSIKVYPICLCQIGFLEGLRPERGFFEESA